MLLPHPVMNVLTPASVRRFASFLMLTMLLTGSLARALTPADQQEIQRFTLDEGFLQKYSDTVTEGRRKHIKTAGSESDPKEIENQLSSLDNMTATITKSPEVVALLQRHGLEPRQLVVGGLVLMRVAITDQMLANPRTAKLVTPAKMPSAANMAFYRSHKERINKLLRSSNSDDDDEDDDDHDN
jgi:hypothetical protein